MTSSPRLAGLVLCGGDSRRMGADKARLPVGGTPLAVHVARRLEPVCETVLLASGDGERYGDLGYPQVADVQEGGGPLAGIIAGLEVATTELVAVVAVDMPHASADVLRLLADRWRDEQSVLPSDGERLQPLHGIYATTAAEPLRAALVDGIRAVHAALDRLHVTVAGPEVWGRVDPDGRFLTNLNDPGDLAALSS